MAKVENIKVELVVDTEKVKKDLEEIALNAAWLLRKTLKEECRNIIGNMVDDYIEKHVTDKHPVTPMWG